MRIAVTICESKPFAVKKAFKAWDGKTDIIELRLDYIENISQLDLTDIIPQNTESRILITNRKKDEGGRFLGSEGERLEILLKAERVGADYLDIELSSGRKAIDWLASKRNKKTKLIISYHNFDRTPKYSDLIKVFQKQIKAGADICKIATKANSVFDNLVIFKLLEQTHLQKCKLIALCMGKKGQLSRIVSPFLGGYLTFVSSALGKESASGQIPLVQFKKIFQQWDLKP